MESSGTTTTKVEAMSDAHLTPLEELEAALPPRPTRAKGDTSLEAFRQWVEDIEAWRNEPAVVAWKRQAEADEEARIDALRPTSACVDCSVQRTPNVSNPWTIVECGPHRVDHYMQAGSMYNPVPKRYAHADPAHLLPALQSWRGEHGLYLTGPVGTGKTYQAAALVRATFRIFDPPNLDAYYTLGTMRSRPVVWANVPKLLEDIRRSFDAPDTAPDGLDTAPLVVLDDIGAEKPSEWVEERLYCVVNERYEADLPVIVTSNLTPSQLGDRVGARLTSRLREMCEMHGLGGRDRRLDVVA